MSSTLRLLPDYVRNADDGTLANYLQGAEDAAANLLSFLTAADPTTSITGTSEPVNPDTCPTSWLPWLARLLGADISGLTEVDARWYLARRGRADVGSTQGIKDAVGATLTGERYVQVTMTSLWEMTITVKSTEVVDAALTLLVAERNKPAGVDLTVASDDPATIADLATTYTTVAGVVASGKTLDQLRFG